MVTDCSLSWWGRRKAWDLVLFVFDSWEKGGKTIGMGLLPVLAMNEKWESEAKSRQLCISASTNWWKILQEEMPDSNFSTGTEQRQKGWWQRENLRITSTETLSKILENCQPEDTEGKEGCEPKPGIKKGKEDVYSLTEIIHAKKCFQS